MSSQQSTASKATDSPQYLEKLYPAPWIWIVALGIAGAAILVFAPIGITIGYIAAAVIFALEATFLVLSTPQIVLTADTLTVGKASIERQYLGAAEAFTGDAASEQRGLKLNGTAFVCLRGWISPVIRVELTDPEDPTPYWLFSTRHPEKLVTAFANN